MINETFLLFNRERLYGKLFYLFITVHLLHILGALFERNQFLNQKPINVIDCITAVDGEVRVPRVDSLKRHVLKRLMINETFLLFNRERLYGKLFYLFITVHLLHILPLMFLSN
jgi:hypothetical protein